jgi:hypothetical protein
MQRFFYLATIFIAACAVFTGASAQTVYRCGNAYSQTPCGDGKTLETGADAPSDAQAWARKKTADAQTKRQTATANMLERDRLAREAADSKLAEAQRKALEKAQAAERTEAQARARAAKSEASSNHSKHTKKKGKEPEFFTAKEAAPAKP